MACKSFLMVGIYKITSPTGKVYIGQSIHIEKRWLAYKRCKNKKIKKQPLIERSLLKYGYDAHKFEVVHELPCDIDKETLARYEQIYMDQYRECGFRMLNLSASSESCYGVKRSKEARKRHSEFLKEYLKENPKKVTEEEKKKISDSLIKYYNSVKPEGFREKQIQKAKDKGKPIKLTEEQKAHLSKINTGKKHTEETKQKVKDNNAKYWLGKTITEEHRKALSDSHKGIIASKESKEKLSESLKLAHKNMSPEAKAARSIKMKEAWRIRKGGVS